MRRQTGVLGFLLISKAGIRLPGRWRQRRMVLTAFGSRNSVLVQLNAG